MLVLASDFILDMDTLDKKELDEQMFEFLSWWTEINVFIDEKPIKKTYFSVDYEYCYYKRENKNISGK